METEPSPLDIQLTRTRLRELAEQLAMEYAGAVVPGRVMRLVLSTGRRLQHRGYNQDEVLRITKATVRADLVTHIGCRTSTTLGAGRREPA